MSIREHVRHEEIPDLMRRDNLSKDYPETKDGEPDAYSIAVDGNRNIIITDRSGKKE